MAVHAPIEQLLQAWKQAEERARKAELRLYRACLDFTAERAEAPPEELRRDAAALRAEARAAYQSAMDGVDRVLAEAERQSRNY